jgi:hypothetical protein
MLAETRHKQYEECFTMHETEIRHQKAALQEIET